MRVFRRSSVASLSFALAVSLALAGCAGWDEIGAEKKTPLVGARKPLFPQGVPGVEFGAPPQQPSNSNIAITPNMGGAQNAQAQDQDAEAQKQQTKADPRQTRAQKAKEQQEARASAQQQQAASRTAARSKKNTESEDPWSETR